MKAKLTQLKNGDWIDLEKVSLLALVGSYDVKIVVEGHECILSLNVAEAEAYRDELAALVNGTPEPQEPDDDVGEGYIRLKVGDVRQEGDEYRSFDSHISPTGFGLWCPINRRLGMIIKACDLEMFHYRRPIRK